MAARAELTYVTMRDSQGRTAKVQVWQLADNTSATTNVGALGANLQNVIGACSNAAVQSYTGGPANPIDRGTNAAYPAAQIKASLIFATAKGALHKFQIPAPKLTGMLADGITVNPADTNFAALITYITSGTPCDRDGVTFATYIAGFVEKRKFPKRVSSIVLAPNGTIPANY